MNPINSLKRYNIYKIITYLVITIVVSIIAIYLTVTSDNFRAGPAFIIITLSIFIGIKILADSQILSNIFFSVSVFGLATSVSIALIGYIDVQYKELFPEATLILIISPLGMFYSTKIILQGKNDWVDQELIIVTSFILFLAFLYFQFNRLLFYLNDLLLSDITLILLLLLLINQFELIGKKLNQKNVRITLMQLGLVLSITGLVFSLFYTAFIDLTGHFFRQLLPMIGILFVAGIFATSPPKTGHLARPLLSIADIINYLNEGVDKIEIQKLLPMDSQEVSDIGDFSQVNSFDFSSINLNNTMLAILLEFSSNYPKPVNNSEISEILDKDRGTISKHFKTLFSLDLIEEGKDLRDIRKKPYSLTEKGINYLFYLRNYLNSQLETNLELINFIEKIFSEE